MLTAASHWFTERGLLPLPPLLLPPLLWSRQQWALLGWRCSQWHRCGCCMCCAGVGSSTSHRGALGARTPPRYLV
jgi:hypothetical protein